MKKITDEFNWFSEGGENYSRYRPNYTHELAEYLAGLAPDTRKALDVGCGTGQLTRLLSHFFTEVTGVDPSEEQLRSASAATGITYIHSTAESLPADFSGYNLITVAQAAHWFRLSDFYREVRRVAASDAIIALISYGVLNIEGMAGERFEQFYYNEIGRFWPAERKLVDSGYRDLSFPFEELKPPSFAIEASWNLQELLGYISTWSAVRQARQQGEFMIMEQFADDLAAIWGNPGERKKVFWPINMRIGRL
ncbi:TPA: class I SAM-dependent methyltransferase [Serratia marcescens]